jgi:hypothetical protein
MFALFAANVVCRQCCWPPVSLIPVMTCKYLREFLKKFEMILMLFPGAWGKMIQEKNPKQKI